MIPRIPLIDGDEYDSLTKGGKRVHRFRAGQRARVKRRYRRRLRRVLRADANPGGDSK